jgi:hypothetical protein
MKHVLGGVVVVFALVTSIALGALPEQDAVRLNVFDSHRKPDGGPRLGDYEDRWYAKDAPWNTLVPRAAAVDRSSSTYVAQLLAADSGINVNRTFFTPPVFRANSTTPRVTVRLAGGFRIDRVPMPPSASVSPDSDAHLAILDWDSGCEYDFWRARKRDDGSWYAETQATFQLWNHGVHEPWTARASGVALGAGLIRPEDIRSGVIEHALAIALPTTASSHRSPATSSDGRTRGGIPMGARLQLDPSFDLQSIEQDGRIIARALQRYGAYVVDTSSAITLYAQNTSSTGGFAYPISWDHGLPGGETILQRLRVVVAPIRPTVEKRSAPGCSQRYRSVG